MAEDPYKTHRWFITFAVIFVSSPCAAEPECSVNDTYDHGALRCCLCGIGRGWVSHCTEDLHYGVCQECEAEHFSSQPGHGPCERCTSCSHESENLKEEEPCTPGQDRKCGCQKDHYCISEIKGSCKLCHPCKQCGDLGVKAACSGRNNTVCNEQVEGGVGAGAIVGIIFGLLATIALVAGAAWYWNKRRSGSQVLRPGINGHSPDVEFQLLNDVDLGPLLPDIATVIGWTDMEHVAIRSGIPDTRIDGCKLNNPGNSEEQTLELLKIFVENEGTNVGKGLIRRLEQGSRKKKADNVKKILMRSSDNNPSSRNSMDSRMDF